jgi:ATP-dependent RNA helicase DDX5/DBP2
LWSATWPPEVHSLADELLNDPVKVVIAGAGLKASHNIVQYFAFLEDDDKKYSAMSTLLDSDFDGGRVLVFCATKRGCDELTRKLRLDGWPAMGIHGDKCQMERDWVLRVRASNCKSMFISSESDFDLNLKGSYSFTLESNGCHAFPGCGHT